MLLLRRRLFNQKLLRSNLRSPADVVRWLGAIQAQDYSAAKWAIGLRAPGASDATVERAFEEGAILRTHVLRPTWHFVAPSDIRWMLSLTGPRVQAANAY
ncbi:MAG TPA: crosslink repair DNA glycosylase YcaQ family protein [Vicinamibacteria bacterium]|nr:crosslink repair DNA glycosylase YcaQ family protein [Vicinamibacteria bacterium]